MFAEVLPSDELRAVVSLFTTPTLAVFLRAHPDFHSACLASSGQRHVSREPAIFAALDSLFAQGTLSEGCSRQDTFCLSSFVVPKQGNVNSRLIIDCRPINELLRSFPAPKMALPDLGDLINVALKHRYMASRDACSMFYQFRLQEDFASLLQLRVGGCRGPFRRARVEVLPMGLSIAPACAQAISNYVCEVVRSRTGGAADILCWVDNFLVFGDTPASVDRTLRTLEQVCGQLHFALKHDEGEASQSMKALGLQFDLALQEVTPSDAAKRAIQDALRVAIADPTGLNFLRWFGHVSWLNHAVGRLPMATHRAIMDTARRVTCRDLQNTTDTNVWAADAETLTVALCSSRRRRTVAPEEQGLPTLWTDASTVGIGAITTDPRREDLGSIFVRLVGIQPKAMCTVELLAGFTGAQHFAAELAPDFVWAIDNQAACRALIRGHSGSAAADAVIATWLRHAPLPCLVMPVPSACQLADEPSRGVIGARQRCNHVHPTFARRFVLP